MAHNLVYFDSSTNSIQKFSNAQLDDLAERVLRVMAAGTYTGTISVGTSNPIGTFADTALVDTAGGPDTTTVTNTYTLSQVATATLGASSDAPMYVGLDTTSPTTTVLQENLTTREQLADEIISRMVAGTYGGTNAYYLGSSAPADGATWTSRGTLLDTITNNTVTVTDYKLWQRTTSGASITNRDPVKLSSGNIQSFTTAEIEALIKTIEERIIATGVGTYVIQASAPGTGTWSNSGSIIDTREDIATSNFVGEVAYTNEDAIAYTATYTTLPAFVNPDGAAFAGFATFTNSFTGSYFRDYLGDYLGPATYFGPTFTPNAPGPTYLGPGPTYFGPATYFGPGPTYLGPATYLGPQTYLGPGPTYLGPDTYFGPATYTGGPFGFSPSFSPTPQGFPPTFYGTRNFTNPDATPFTNPNATPFTGVNITPFVNPNVNPFVNPDGTPFTGVDVTPFTNPNDTPFTNPNATPFTQTFPPTVNPDGQSFTNPDGTNFVGTYEGEAFLGPTIPVSYFGPATYLGPVAYDSTPTDYDGVTYSGPEAYAGSGNYEGTRVAPTTSTISTKTLWRRVA